MGWASGFASGVMLGNNAIGQYRMAEDAARRDALDNELKGIAAARLGEALLDHATMLANDIKHGRADTSAMLKFAELQKTVQDEGYMKNLTLAQSGAPLTQVVAAFNAQGSMKIDPASIISDKMVDRGAGVKSRIVTFKGQDGATHTIDTLAELDTLGKADKVFARAYAANADSRAGAAAGRAAQEFAAGAGERQAKGALGALQAELLDPKTTPERAQQIGGRIAALNGVMGKGGEQPADVKLAQAWIRANNGKVSEKDALIWARTNQDQSPQALRAKFLNTALSANFGNAGAAKKTVDELMAYMQQGGGAGAGTTSFATVADAEKAAKDGKIKDGDRISIAGRSGTWRQDGAGAPAAGPAANSAAPARVLAAQGVMPIQTKAPDTGLEGLSSIVLASIAADPSHPRAAAARAMLDKTKAERNAAIQGSMDAADSLMPY